MQHILWEPNDLNSQTSFLFNMLHSFSLPLFFPLLKPRIEVTHTESNPQRTSPTERLRKSQVSKNFFVRDQIGVFPSLPWPLQHTDLSFLEYSSNLEFSPLYHSLSPCPLLSLAYGVTTQSALQVPPALPAPNIAMLPKVQPPGLSPAHPPVSLGGRMCPKPSTITSTLMIPGPLSSAQQII